MSRGEEVPAGLMKENVNRDRETEYEEKKIA